LIEEGNPLFQELTMMSDAKLVSGSGVGVTSSQDSKEEAENYTDQKWMPDPVDAPPGKQPLSISLSLSLLPCFSFF